MRYIVRAPRSWPEEYCIYIVVLMVYFLQCRLEFKGEQLGIGIIDTLLVKHKTLRIIATLIHGAVAIVVFAVLFKVGLTVVQQQYIFGIISPVIRFPMVIYFGLINGCFVLVIAFWAIRFITKDYDVVEGDALIE
jgi:TRAP-type C4-dicarboxylate transport system permease small subunit